MNTSQFSETTKISWEKNQVYCTYHIMDYLEDSELYDYKAAEVISRGTFS